MVRRAEAARQGCGIACGMCEHINAIINDRAPLA
jgi:hypothetical protein